MRCQEPPDMLICKTRPHLPKVNRSVCYLALVDHVLELLLNERKTP